MTDKVLDDMRKLIKLLDSEIAYHEMLYGPSNNSLNVDEYNDILIRRREILDVQ